MNTWDFLYHLMTHFGIGLLMIPIIAWIAWRTGQLAQPKQAAALPLTVGGIDPEEDCPPPRRFPIVVLVLAIVLGLGLGVPIATTFIASNLADPGAAITNTEEAGH